ncbi:MAG: hypothetical protein KDF60_14235 [Calditrichaeota bacterium]|nr:hypothetical protein [Calditrichota bacterium]
MVNPNLFAVKILILTTFLSLLMLIPSQASEDQNNLKWIENNLITVFDSLALKKIISKEEAANIEFGVVSGEKKGFLKNTLIQWLEQGNPPEKLKSESKIYVEQFNIRIVYQQEATGFLGLSTEYVRKNNIVLSGWIGNADGSKLKVLNINKEFSEKVKTDNLAELEESPYSFTRGNTQELSIWTSTIEPVMAISSVAIIVYLFFSVRS